MIYAAETTHNGEGTLVVPFGRSVALGRAISVVAQGLMGRVEIHVVQAEALK